MFLPLLRTEKGDGFNEKPGKNDVSYVNSKLF